MGNKLTTEEINTFNTVIADFRNILEMATNKGLPLLDLAQLLGGHNISSKEDKFSLHFSNLLLNIKYSNKKYTILEPITYYLEDNITSIKVNLKGDVN